MRGEVYRLNAPRDSHGHEQAGPRYAVVVQSDDLPLSTWLVAPTSTSARPATFRPEVEIAGRATLILAEQTAAIILIAVSPDRFAILVMAGTADPA